MAIIPMDTIMDIILPTTTVEITTMITGTVLGMAITALGCRNRLHLLHLFYPQWDDPFVAN